MTVSGQLPSAIGIGRKQAALTIQETTIGVRVGAINTGRRVDIISGKITETSERIEKVNKRQTANINERLQGKNSGSFELEMYAVCAAIGVAPDWRDLLRAAGFAETVNVGVSVVYNPTNTLITSGFLLDSDVAGQYGNGCVVESVKISVKGSAEARIAFSGMVADVARAGCSTVPVAEGAGQPVITVANARNFLAGSFVQFTGDTNAGAGYEVTASDVVLNEITITPVLLVGVAGGAEVVPFIPDLPTVGTPLVGIAGSLVFAGATIDITDAEITVENVVNTNMDQFGETSYTRAELVDQRVNASFTLFGTKAQIVQWANSARFENGLAVLVIGNATPNRIEVRMPKFEFNLDELDIPEVEQIMIKATGIAMKTNLVNDSIQIKTSY